MSGQDILKIVFISLCSAIVIAATIVIWVLVYKNVYYPKKYKEVHYKEVAKIVNNQDYRLINRFIFRIEENKKAVIDHIIFGEKFIYLVFSRYYKGNLEGKLDDSSFIITNKKGKKMYTENPFKYMNFVVSRLCINSGLEDSLLIGIVMVNNDCAITIPNKSEKFFVINKKRLPKLIKEFESKDIGKFKEDELQKAILVLDKMNRRKSNGR